MNFSIFIFKVLAIALLSWASGLILTWWSFAVVAFFAGMLLQKSALLNFSSGFLGTGLYYMIATLWAGTADNFSFADKVAAIFSESLPMTIDGSALLWIGTLLFALIGALSSLSGALLMAPEPGNRLEDRRRTKSKRLKLDL